MVDKKLQEDEVKALLSKLQDHFGEPVMPVSQYCKALRTWARCIEELNEPKRDPYCEVHHFLEGDGRCTCATTHAHGRDYAKHLHRILIDISKSNLLYRLLYAGESLRTQKCPEHKGQWSGLPSLVNCPHGCDGTGWLREPEDEDHNVKRSPIQIMIVTACAVCGSTAVPHACQGRPAQRGIQYEVRRP